MVLYKCEKCNKEFNQKSNYMVHINRKKSCIVNENTDNNINTLIYKCEKCNKEFTKKYNYSLHINKNNPCNSKDLIKENKILLSKIKKLEKNQTNNIQLENEILKLKEENKKINELYNNLLEKCIKNNNNIITNNNTNTVNNNNTINITLTNFGNEKYTKLTNDEQIRILKSNKQCVSNLIKFLHINDRLPEYKNICIKNLRGKGGYLYEGNKWLHCNFENLLMILFKNKINDLEKILNNNEGLNNYNNNYIQNLIENYTDDMDTFIKNNKDNIINMLYNNTKNYKII
jgi:DNA-directed RNA polymerase subunit RPC12/RpoP